jgi:hypothetical protein
MNRTTLFSSLVLALVASLAGCKQDDAAGGKNGGAGGALGEGPEARFFLPTAPDPDNTSAPTLALDGGGALHAVFPAYAGGRAYYAWCPADCASSEAVKVVRLETDATVHDAMLALDAEGRPRVLLATASSVYYATCDEDCTNGASWTSSKIIEHGGDKQVSGKAFALDANGRPRFLMHTYKAYLGVGQKTPATWWVACDAKCDAPSSWKASKIADEMWRGTQLRFDADGKAKVGTVFTVGRAQYSSGKEMAAYAECAGNCGDTSSWKGITFMQAFESDLDAVAIPPSISLALTKSGAPRVLFLGRNDETLKRNLAYFECDADCTQDKWTGSILSDLEKLGAGVDLQLDANDHPRFVHTISYNIALAWCDDASCGAADAKWNLKKVEYGSEMKPDEIFLYDNCNVAAWFLHSPSLVLTPDGRPRVGYQARDISGGVSNPDKTKPRCVAGTDMTWSRVAMLRSYK